jgi:4-amino-4-deoxy-L-arabinose transferase-like glycosyltransferase
MTPVFGLGSVLIIGLGLYRIIRTYETTRSYLLLIWSACLIPVLLINPVFVTVLFVPAVLLIAAGLTSLITYWYQLFPRNPYARIAGLIPLIILIGTLSISGLDRYMFGYHYNPNTAANFSKDLRLLPGDTTTLIVAPEEQPFYESVAKYNDSLIVVTTIPENIDQFTTTHETNASYDGYTVERIVTNSYSNDSDRFYLYQKTEK